MKGGVASKRGQTTFHSSRRFAQKNVVCPLFGVGLAFAGLALGNLLYLAFFRAACHGGFALGFRCRLFARYPLQLLAFFFIFYVLRVHWSTLIPAYFSTSNLSP